MRFALMLEPQQGLTYGEQLAIARRAESVGFEALFRSDHYQSFPGPAGRPTTDAWAVLAGPGAGHDDDPARRARLAGHVPAARQPREGRDDGRRDERRPARGRARRGLERRRASPARLPVPADRRAGGHARGAAGDPPRALGASPTAGRSRAATTGSRTRCSARKPVVRPSARTRPPIIVGGEGTPRSMRIAARYADEFNVIVARTRRAVDAKFARARRGVRGDRPRPGDDRALGDGRRAGRPGRGASVERRGARSWPPSTSRRQGEAWFADARDALDHRDAGRGPGDGRRVRRGRRRADHAPGLPAARPRDGRPHGRGAVGRSLNAAGPGPARARPDRHGPRDRHEPDGRAEPEGPAESGDARPRPADQPRRCAAASA